MSYKTYIAQAEENVFDLAIKLHKDARGISDIILLNPALDLEASTYFGLEIIYDAAVVYKREIFTTSQPKPTRPNWIVREGQTVFDLALQIYGDVSNIDKVIAQLGETSDPAVGVEVETEHTDNILALTLFSQKIVATSAVYADTFDSTFDHTFN